MAIFKKSDPPMDMRPVPQRTGVSFSKASTAALAVASGGMLGMATVNLIGADSYLDLCKAVLLAGAGTLVSYGTNSLAVEKGAPQAAIGMVMAKVGSVASIAIVGGGLFTATYSGLVIEEIRDLRLREHGQALAVFVDYRSRKATENARALPVLETIVDDLSAKELCEIQSSCLSGSKHTGAGPVARKLAEKRRRAEDIAGKIQNGDADRKQAINQLNDLLARYQEILDDPEIGKAERLKLLQVTHAHTSQQLSALDEAMPTAMLAAYVAELQSPTTIDGKREASRKVSNLLSAHGDNLQTVLQSIDRGDERRPLFPGETGVTETFSYIGHFLPIAAIVIVAELIFPAILWLYTYLGLAAQVARQETPASASLDAGVAYAANSATPPPKTEPARRPGRPRKNATSA